MRNFVLTAALAVSCASLRADYTYTQTSQMTGGAMVTMMRNLGPLAGRTRDPIVTTHILKGNRMAAVTKDSITVTDLDAETITNIDLAKKTYSVMTFAQMKQAAEQALARAEGKQTKGGDIQYKVSAKATGQSKTINGLNAKQVVTTMEADVKDQKSGQTGAMNIVMENWLAQVPGYDEVKAFQRRMGAKMGYLAGAGMSPMAAMQPQTMRGFAQVAEEMAKVDGVAIEQVMKMGGSVDGAEGAAPPQQESPRSQQQSNQQANPQSGQQSAGAAAAAAALGRFGGFGRNRNKGNDQQQAPQQQDPAGGAAPASSGALMEMTISLAGFSSAPADTSKFDVPAGFKQVESAMAKALK